MPVQTYPYGYRPSTVALHHHAVEKVIRAMHEQLDRALSLEDMAAIANSSPYHFNRVFRLVTGIPPSHFLYALRLQKAKQLLLTTLLSVTDICYEVGYNSVGSFTQRFTELVGVPPTQWRQLAEGEALSTCLENLLQQVGQHTTASPSIRGQITSPSPFEGPLFIGLFAKPIPQGQPVQGTLIMAPGPFQITQVPPGCYYAFAAGFPWPSHPLGYLLPDETTLQVGAGNNPITLPEDEPFSEVNITLRPMDLCDPPILIALPLLLTRHLALHETPSLSTYSPN